ncbi:MAG: TonB-dependent receptor domain-containing protein [Vulcanimicrobiaceae bacterium]
MGAQFSGGSVAGFVVDQLNGLPIPRANVDLYLGDTFVETGNADTRGAFRFDSLRPGLYTVSITAQGYQNSTSREFAVTAGQETSLNLAVSRANQSQESSELKTIGSVAVNSTNSLASTTAITNSLDPAVLQKENNIGFASSLVRLPGVNSTGLSSSVSDDQYIDIRGLGESETQALLDGHPVGPQGVYGINGGGSYPKAFNYSDTPVFGLRQVQVTFGSGATGLYGVDAIGGTVDLQTLNPTTKPASNFWQGYGDQGRAQTAFNATGTYGRISYAVAAGVLGTYGMFAPGLIAQTGRPNNNANANNGGACTAGNDISPCNLALNSYSVSQNSTLRAGLAKLRFDLSNNTSFTTRLYSSGQRSDSTGNGDNDNIPYDTRLAQIQSNPGNCALPGDPAGTTSGYAVITVANPSNTPNACYSAGQFAQASYGPYGGGADRNRGVTMTDYDFKLQSVSGKNTFIADGYYNYYKFYKSSEEAAGLDPTGSQFAGTAYSQFMNTQGYLIADDVQNTRSDIGVGYFGEYQLGTRLDYNTVGQGLFSYETPESTHYNSGFVRASYDLSHNLSAFGNFWIKSDSVIGDTNFDPRLSLVLRPVPSDVFRVTYGHSTGDPAAELKASGPPSINGNPSSLNPSCTPYNVIGSGGNPGIQAEGANDYEVGYAHRFQRDSSIAVNLYYTSVRNQLFAANEPLSQYGAVPIASTLLQGFADKIASVCPAVDVSNPASVLPFLAISTTYNAASAVSKGIELSGRQRLNRHFYLDYTYDLQSVTQSGINDNILQNNPFIINNGQVQGIPINQATIGLDYTNAGLEARMDGYVVGNNNPSRRPAYNVWNGFVSQTLPGGFSITLGVQNIFNEASQQYGYFGHEPLIPENHFFSDTTPIQQYLNTGSNEEFGLPTRSILLTLSSRV